MADADQGAGLGRLVVIGAGIGVVAALASVAVLRLIGVDHSTAISGAVAGAVAGSVVSTIVSRKGKQR